MTEKSKLNCDDIIVGHSNTSLLRPVRYRKSEAEGEGREAAPVVAHRAKYVKY